MAICRIRFCEQEVSARGYCHRHYYVLRRRGELHVRTESERFWSKVEKTDTCWLWTGNKTKPGDKGYGRFWIGDSGILAHRYSYELHKGPIPEGLQIDHLCRVRLCVNPDHLEVVTGHENVLRGEQARTGTHCAKGHELEGKRHCRRCEHERKLEWQRKKSEDPAWRERRRALERARYHRRKETAR